MQSTSGPTVAAQCNERSSAEFQGRDSRSKIVPEVNVGAWRSRALPVHSLEGNSCIWGLIMAVLVGWQLRHARIRLPDGTN